MKRWLSTFGMVIFVITLEAFGILTYKAYNLPQESKVESVKEPEQRMANPPIIVIETMNVTINQPVQRIPESVIVSQNDISLADSDIELIALVTMGEAEGESEYGKRLVIDTILNRMENDIFPDTANGVVYQKSQFACVSNGRLKRCSVKNDICELVRQEARHRTNSDVIFFTAGKYGRYGTPLFNEGNHYFCSL